LPSPGVIDVIVTSGVSPGRRPKRSALKIRRSENRPIPVALSGVMLRARVFQQGCAPGCTAQGPM
jgi:hypothetical protein